MIPTIAAWQAWWQVWGIFLVVSLISRFPYFFQGDIDWDESTFILLGQSVLEEHLPYTDVLDVKPPLLWYGFAALIFLGGKTFLGIRALGAIVVGTIAYLSYLVTRRIWDLKTAWIAGLSWIILINFAPGGQAILSEHLALLFLGACFTLLAIGSEGVLPSLGAGILMGAAVLVRLNLAYTAICLGLYFWIQFLLTLLPSRGQQKSQIQQKGLACLAFSIGGLLPLIAIVFPYFWTENLPAFYIGFIKASLSYTKQYSLLSVLWFQFQKVIFLRLSFVGIVVSIIIFWALGSHFRWFWHRFWHQRLTPQQSYLYRLVALFVFSIELSILQTGAFYSHYTIQFLFFISILIAKPIEKLIRINTKTWLKPYLKLSLAIVMCTHLWQYGLITRLWLQQGTPFYGPSFDIAKVIRAEQLQGQPLWIQTDHLAYWLTQSPPVTPAVTHPSNITKPLLLKAWYGENASTLTELQKIIDRHPALIVSNEKDGGIHHYFRSDPAAQALLEATIRDDYQVLAYPDPELQFYRHNDQEYKTNLLHSLDR